MSRHDSIIRSDDIVPTAASGGTLADAPGDVLTIGIDIGGTKIAAGLSDGQSILLQQSVATAAADSNADSILQRAITLADDVHRQAIASGATAGAIGIGAAGQIDSQRGVVVDANDNLPGWRGLDIATPFARHFGLPVHVDNDVNVLALGESIAGVGRDYQQVLYITVGTGIGGALVQDGRIRQGAHGSAGEVGYLVATTDSDGTVHSVEQMASGPAMTARYNMQSDEPAGRFEQVVARADSGDHRAQTIIVRGATLAGHVIGRFACAFDPQVLVVGGGIARSGARWWDAFTAAVAAAPLVSTRAMPVLHARLDQGGAVFGAALLARQHLGLPERSQYDAQSRNTHEADSTHHGYSGSHQAPTVAGQHEPDLTGGMA